MKSCIESLLMPLIVVHLRRFQKTFMIDLISYRVEFALKKNGIKLIDISRRILPHHMLLVQLKIWRQAANWWHAPHWFLVGMHHSHLNIDWHNTISVLVFIHFLQMLWLSKWQMSCFVFCAEHWSKWCSTVFIVIC